MRPLLVSAADGKGGAARAAWRLQSALRRSNVDSTMLVGHKTTDVAHVVGDASFTSKALTRARLGLAQKLIGLQMSSNGVFRSPAMFPTGRARKINASNADVVNLHWVGGEMLSVEEIGRIRKPVVWTMHDTWAFCGAEHYPDGAGDRRYVEGYRRSNRPSDARGPDIDAWVWRRKMKAWKTPLHIVCPGAWMASCANESRLFRDWPVSVVPYALPTKILRPWPKKIARQMFDLPETAPLILFGAIGGTQDKRKGWDLLLAAMPEIASAVPDSIVVVFGSSASRSNEETRLPVHYIGPVNDDVTLALLYSAADVMAVPSRVESFGQTATEAMACGLPVVAFRYSGLVDIVDHRVSGYLAEPFRSDDLAAGIAWVLADDTRRHTMALAARDRAEREWSPEAVVPQYMRVYADAIRAFGR